MYVEGGVNMEERKGYKGYEEGLICRNKQYEENRVFREEEAKVKEVGMHFCDEPLEVWAFYPPGTDEELKTQEYTSVESLGLESVSERSIGNHNARTGIKLISTTELRIGKKIPLFDYIIEAINYIQRRVRKSTKYFLYDFSGERAALNYGTEERSEIKNSGPHSIAINRGSRSLATIVPHDDGKASMSITNGVMSVARNCDMDSIALNTGNYGATINEGQRSLSASIAMASVATTLRKNSIAANTGLRATALVHEEGFSIAASSGLNGIARVDKGAWESVAVSSGMSSIAEVDGELNTALTSGPHSIARVLKTGRDSVAIVTGCDSEASANGENSIAIATEKYSKVKGSLGSWILCVERDASLGNKILSVKAAKVDGEIIKPDVYYTLVNGEFVEAKLKTSRRVVW